jgi:hypothetical protein
MLWVSSFLQNLFLEGEQQSGDASLLFFISVKAMTTLTNHA